MTDYEKMKVTDLRSLLKERGIPSTGLTRKAQIIEKLEEHDSADAAAATEPDTAADEPQQDGAIEGAMDGAADAQEAPELRPQEAPTSSAPVPETEPIAATEETEKIEEATAQESPVEQAEEKQEGESAQDVAEPAEESKTETQDFAPAVKTPSPASNEQPSVEKPLPMPPHEPSVDSVSIASEELEADRRKRKRRSTSPDIPLPDIKAKKPRPSDDVPDVHLKEDEDVVMMQAAPEEEAVVDQPEATAGAGEAATTQKEEADEGNNAPDAQDATEDTNRRSEEQPRAPQRREKDARYKDLLRATPREPDNAAISAEQDDAPIQPALHVATPALYIKNLMRPLRIEALRAHLVSLATPPSASPDTDVVKALFLDSMKSHALLLFSNTAAASRVRASLHNTVWPAESQRKALWIDFIPEDKVLDWIKEEEDHIAAEKAGRASGKPIPSQRFEVVYTASSGSGSMEAIFQEVGSQAPRNAPTGPRSSNEQRRRSSQQQPLPAPVTTDEDVKRNLGKSFQTLDQLFLFTEAKPKLYFLPMTDKIADDRLDDLQYETSRDWQPGYKMRGRGAHLDQKMRYSFDEDDRVVEVGGDFGPWADDSRGGRGGRGGGFRSERGGGRGGWRGRGGFPGGF
ncbi:hypothetical protein M011DRAFT_464038 [Sporormia fimetaria CBS 119925]|uniref:SAP domain-containing protein n=1 Tax=Sporormia fimetaria CBS 119925 TaxID=1340428 RepID=A0A6A6VPV4_9PLEO|nr:hypothetical protein M011DRAFT_464038 [Sporormia fimetaria CBS 119925]